MAEGEIPERPSRELKTKNSTGSKEQHGVGASSESPAFFVGNRHLPNSELSSNTLRHPAETFPWLSKEAYFQQRDQYITTWGPIGENALSQNGQFTYRDNPDITHTAATLFSRALFVADYFKEHHHYDKSIPIKIYAGTHFVNNYIGAETWPFFYLKDEYVHRYFDTDPADIENLKLTEIQIYFNMNKLGVDIEETIELAKQLKRQGEPEKHVDTWQQDYIEWLGIDQENAMVEEMAHAFYFINAAQNHESLKRLLQEATQYPRSYADINRPRTPEELKTTMSFPIEQDGAKWADTFMQRYYPDTKYR
jgi:hypothetical protein